MYIYTYVIIGYIIPAVVAKMRQVVVFCCFVQMGLSEMTPKIPKDYCHVSSFVALAWDIGPFLEYTRSTVESTATCFCSPP